MLYNLNGHLETKRLKMKPTSSISVACSKVRN